MLVVEQSKTRTLRYFCFIVGHPHESMYHWRIISVRPEYWESDLEELIIGSSFHRMHHETMVLHSAMHMFIRNRTDASVRI